MEFVKGHATANDFILVDDLADELELSVPLVRALCDRRRGIGADGVLRLTAPPEAAGDVFMDYRNADGSAAAICGNGLRLVAKHVADHGIVDVPGDSVRIATRAGVRTARLERGADGRVTTATVDMGAPSFSASAIPYKAGRGGLVEAVEQLHVDGEGIELSPLSMGNPHAVLVVDDVEAASVTRLGPRLEHHDAFPERANVEFAQPVDDTHLRLRVWERGIGETASCGTGVCAAVVALHRRGLVGPEVEVATRGGNLQVRWERPDPPDPHGAGTVWLTGPVVEVAHGRVDDAWLAAVGPDGLAGSGLDRIEIEATEGSL